MGQILANILGYFRPIGLDGTATTLTDQALIKGHVI